MISWLTYLYTYINNANIRVYNLPKSNHIQNQPRVAVMTINTSNVCLFLVWCAIEPVSNFHFKVVRVLPSLHSALSSCCIYLQVQIDYSAHIVVKIIPGSKLHHLLQASRSGSDPTITNKDSNSLLTLQGILPTWCCKYYIHFATFTTSDESIKTRFFSLKNRNTFINIIS